MLENENIRNFGIIAHIDAGKTTTTERILYLTGMNYKIGEVDDGTTTTDWMEEEKEHGITITSASVSSNWKNSVFHIIDTPGHVDFTAEVQRCLRVLDGAVVIFCGVSGVQTQSETVWKQADYYQIPRIVFINKLDRTGANFEHVLKDMIKKLNITPVPLTIPYYKNDLLKGVIDLISMKLLTFSGEGKSEEILEIPREVTGPVNKFRDNLINILTSYDDHLLELALENKLTDEIIIKAIRSCTIKRFFVPVICGSSLKNIGIPPLLDAIDRYLPAPTDIGVIDALNVKKNIREKLEYKLEGPPVVYVFKVQYHREKSVVAFVRIYSGRINNGDILYNPRTKKRERIHDILKVYADKFERITEAKAGDIVTITGIKQVSTGDTLCNESHQIVLESLTFPEPVIYIRIEPKNATDKEKFNTIKDHLLLEDPTITCTEDNQTGQTLIGGMGELHIQIFLERIKKMTGIELRSGAPQVAYRESPKLKGSLTYNFDKKIEGNAQHAEISLTISPNERGKGNIIQSKLVKKEMELIPFIENGINSALRSGPEGAYPVTDTLISIDAVDYDPSRSNPLALEAAASICTSNLLREITTILLEPIMKLEIDIPAEYTGPVIGELQSRNGIILDVQKNINQDIIFAKAPLKVMFGYTTILRSLTQGKGAFSMEFLEYDNI